MERLYDCVMEPPQTALIWRLFKDAFFIFCEYMIWGVTAPVFNLTLALKNVTDFTPPTHHYRLHRASYSQRRAAPTHLPVFTQLRAFLLFSLIQIKCIHLKETERLTPSWGGAVTECCVKRLLIKVLINTNHCYLLLCGSFNHVFNLPGWQSPPMCSRLCLDLF